MTRSIIGSNGRTFFVKTTIRVSKEGVLSSSPNNNFTTLKLKCMGGHMTRSIIGSNGRTLFVKTVIRVLKEGVPSSSLSNTFTTLKLECNRGAYD